VKTAEARHYPMQPSRWYVLKWLRLASKSAVHTSG